MHVQVYQPLTAGQVRYLAEDPADVVITGVNSEGWILVESMRAVGEEGSGVWVDTEGAEQFGPFITIPAEPETAPSGESSLSELVDDSPPRDG